MKVKDFLAGVLTGVAAGLWSMRQSIAEPECPGGSVLDTVKECF